LEKLVHLKICGSQANNQQFHDAFDLQDRPFRRCVIVVEVIPDDLYGFVDWNTGENTDDVQTNEGI
jgi:hypothetical protein